MKCAGAGLRYIWNVHSLALTGSRKAMLFMSIPDPRDLTIHQFGRNRRGEYVSFLLIRRSAITKIFYSALPLMCCVLLPLIIVLQHFTCVNCHVHKFCFCTAILPIFRLAKVSKLFMFATFDLFEIKVLASILSTNASGRLERRFATTKPQILPPTVNIVIHHIVSSSVRNASVEKSTSPTKPMKSY
jgi:hypothetical protein